MMYRTSLSAALIASLALFVVSGCGGDDETPPTPADVASDAGAADDSGSLDSGSTTEDSGSTTEDSGSTTEDSGSTAADTAQPDTAPPPECKKDAECATIIAGLDQCQEAICETGVCVAKAKSNGSACDDGDKCTDKDACKAGACEAGPSVQCDDNNSCTKDSCDSATGKCSNVKLSFGTKCDGDKVCKQGACVTPDSCTTGACCNEQTKTIEPKTTKCGTKALSEEYECDNNTLRKRSVFAGCNGNHAKFCSTSASNLAYGKWSTVKTCAKTELCNAETKACEVKPACQVDKNCGSGEMCKDGKCIKDPNVECTTGKCCDWAAKKYKAAGTKCGTVSQTTEWRCSGATLEKRFGFRGCTGKASTCSKNAANYVFGKWKAEKSCASGKICQDDPPGCVTPPPKCPAGVCCDPKKGYKPAGTQCGTIAIKTEAKCFGTDSKLRKTYHGCSGKASTCSNAKEDYVVGEWGSGVSCANGCDLLTGTCKPKTGCSNGLCCNKTTKNFYPKGYKCGTKKVKTEYKCDAGSQFSRVAYDGCNGVGAKCSTLAKNYHWTGWSLDEKCLAGCDKATGKCIQNQCTSGACCVPVVNLLSPKNAKCNGTSTKVRVRCVDGSSGSSLITEKGTYLCDGTKSDCPKSTDLMKWEQSAVPVPCKYGCDKSKTKCKVPACEPGGANICCENDGTYSKQGTKCPSSLFPVSTEYQCVTKDSKQYSKSRPLYLGCSGSTKTCSPDPANFAKGAWSSEKLCGFGCATDGSCKSKQCTSGACCISVSGTYAGKGNKCGSTVKETYYVCKTIGGMPWSQEYKKYEGCSGKSEKCTTDSANYAHVNGALIICPVGCDSKTGKCLAPECSTGACCSSGKYLAKNAKCGGTSNIAPVTNETRCLVDSVTKQSYQETRYAYKGCTGSSASCSTSKDNYHWTSWSGKKTCTFGCDNKKCADKQCTSGTCCNTWVGAYFPAGTKCSSVVKDTRYTCSCNPFGCWSQKQIRFEGCSGSKSTCGGGMTSWTDSTTADATKFCLNGCNSDGKCK